MVSRPDSAALCRSLKLVAVVAVVAASYFFLVSAPLHDLSKRGMDILPPESGDGVDYEHIAYNISEGRGFSVYWDDDAWRAAYLPYQEIPAFRGIVAREGELRPTAYRPPLYPMALATVYEALGRNFFFARLFNFWFIWAGVLLTAFVALRSFGRLAALTVVALSAFDRSLPFWSYYFLTEPLSFLLCAFLLVVVVEYSKLQRPHLYSLLAGAIFGLLILTRSITLLWCPAIIFCIAFFPYGWGRKVRFSLMFLFATMLPLSFWIGRNVTVIGPTAYFGTQSGVNFAADYSDPMIRSGGVWISHVWNEVRIPFNESPETGNLEGLEREIAADAWGKRQGLDWIRDNPWKVPVLMALKIKSLWWRDIQVYHLCLGIVCLFSLSLCRSSKFLIVPLLVILGNTVSVALTHNVPAGRFLFLVLPCLYLVTAGIVDELAKRCLLSTRSVEAKKDELQVP